MKRFLIAFFLFFCFTAIYAQDAREKGYSAITQGVVQGQLEFLASDWMEGRAVGSRGVFLASDYIASMFKTLGIAPYGDEDTTVPDRAALRQGKRPEKRRSYFQHINFIEYQAGEKQFLSIIDRQGSSVASLDLGYKTEFSVQTGVVGVSGEAPLYFAGYGLSNKEYDDLKKTDLKGKVAVILHGFPGHRDTTTKAFQMFRPSGREASYYFERNKIRRLSDLGAIAVIVIQSPAQLASGWAINNHYPYKGAYYEADQRLSSFYDTRVVPASDTLKTDIPVFSVSSAVAAQLFSGTAINPIRFENEAARNLATSSALLSGKEARWKTTVDSKIIRCRNVMGFIEGKKKDEFIVVGAHYDHVGKYEGWTWNGADDNGSGTVGMMTIAKAFIASGQQPEKSIIFAAWTAEEKGLWGSRHFVENRPENMKVRYNLNLDMISRNSETDSLGNRMTMIYTSTASGLRTLTEKNIAEFNLPLQVSFSASAQPSGGSDHAPFAAKGIPVTFFFAAMHPDYHMPSDELSKVNWEKMTNITKLGYLNVWELANSDKYLKPE